MPMPWDLGLNTCGPADGRRLQTLVDAGFRFVYLDGSSLAQEHLAEGRAAGKAFASRLEPWSIHFPILFSGWDLDEPAVQARLLGLLDLAEPYGVHHATVHAPCYTRLNGGQSDEGRVGRHRAQVQRILRVGAERAKELGLSLNVENCACATGHGTQESCMATVAGLREFVSDVGDSLMGVCLDTGHANLAGQHPGAMIRELGDLMRETHFNDNFGPFPGVEPVSGDFHRPPGIGSIDWLDVMDALDEIQYPHPVVFEVGMVQVGGDTFEFLARATHDNWRAFERARAKRDGRDPAAG